MKILVIDDSQAIRKLIRQELSASNHQITEASSGKEALSYLFEETFDLITLDVEMPGMNGYDVCQKLRKMELATARSATPVLFVTSSDTMEGRIHGFEAGATDFFIKPFETGDLLSAVDKFFSPDRTFADKTVLIVDDSPLIRQILVSTLKTEGLKTIVATNGQEAFETIKTQASQIDLVLTDYDMPEMNGEELCYQIRNTLGLKQLPVIFLTAASITEYILKMFRSGATDLLNKPFSQEELVARIRVHLREKDLREKLHEKIIQLRKAKKELEVMAVTDGLTGLYNHRHIYELLGHRIEECKRYGQSLCILMLDIDHFKSVNDRFGHQRGDEVLAKVANVILHEIREVDLAARYGGEEFIVIFPNTDFKGAQLAAEKIRVSVENLVWQDNGLSISISGGISEYHGQSEVDLIKSADQLLYQSKQNGRNQISG